MKMKVNTNKQEMKLGYAALIYAMILLFVLANSFCAGLIDPQQENWKFFYMFTNQSNFLVLIWLVLFGISAFVDTPFKRFVTNRTVMTALTVYISITFFIVVTVLDPFYKGAFDPLNVFVRHSLTPIVMWFFFFAVNGNGSMKLRQAFYILIYPFVFMVVNLIIGSTVTYINGEPAFAYGFINYTTYPNGFVFALVMLLLVGVFGGLGVLLMLFKRFLIKHYYGEEHTAADCLQKTV